MGTGTILLAWMLSTSPPPADAYYMNVPSIAIPIHLNPDRRAQIKELILYYSSDQGKTWAEVATTTPDHESFPYYAPSDGIYWFNVQVVDFKGKRDPEDIYKAAPLQKIVVDTAKPVVRNLSGERQGDEVIFQWDIDEEYPDWNTLRTEYHQTDEPATTWHSIPIMSGPSGKGHFRLDGNVSVTVRLQVKDRAGNQSLISRDITAAGNQQPTQYAAAKSAPVPVTSAPNVPSPFPSTPPAFDIPRPSGTTAPVSEPRAPTETSHYSGTSPSNYAPAADVSTRLVASSEGAREMGAIVPAKVSPHQDLPALQMVNTNEVSLDYEAKAGPSGVTKVELWMTKDEGKSWEKFAEDADLKPPITVTLPGEGVYGFSLIISSLAGQSKKRPSPGDAPELRIELDKTPPRADLYAPEPQGDRADALVLSWNAADKNLAPNPISLEWSEQRDGQWHVIAAELPNTPSQYTWQPPSSIPVNVYLRLKVRDTANNISDIKTKEPVLIDLKKPEGRLLGISKVAHRGDNGLGFTLK